LTVDGSAVTFSTARRGLGGAAARPGPFLAVPNVTAHPSTTSVPITALLYNGPLFCGFNIAIKRLTSRSAHQHNESYLSSASGGQFSSESRT